MFGRGVSAHLLAAQYHHHHREQCQQQKYKQHHCGYDASAAWHRSSNLTRDVVVTAFAFNFGVVLSDAGPVWVYERYTQRSRTCHLSMQHACTSAEGPRTTSGAMQSNRKNAASATSLGTAWVHAHYPTTRTTDTAAATRRPCCTRTPPAAPRPRSSPCLAPGVWAGSSSASAPGGARTRSLSARTRARSLPEGPR